MGKLKSVLEQGGRFCIKELNLFLLFLCILLTILLELLSDVISMHPLPPFFFVAPFFQAVFLSRSVLARLVLCLRYAFVKIGIYTITHTHTSLQTIFY